MRLRQVVAGDGFLRSTQGAVDLVHNLARRLAVDAAGAADLVQETYLRAQAWSTGTRPRRIEPWLATICLNVGRDRLRHKGRHPEVLLADWVADVDRLTILCTAPDVPLLVVGADRDDVYAAARALIAMQ